MKARVLAGILLLAAGAAHADDRRSVKNMVDPGAKDVRLTPVVPTTVRAMTLLPVPQNIFGPRGRFVRVAPVETTVWRVRARLVRVHQEYDGDLHLTIEEPADSTVAMIAEVPMPRMNLAHAAEWRAVRAALTPDLVGKVIVLEGVGFFDYPHADRAAPNGIELHPVLALKFEAKS